MENRQQQILDEIKSLMESIRTQISDLETKMSELQYMVDPEAVDIDVMDMELEPVQEEVSDDLPFFDDLPEAEETQPAEVMVEEVPSVEVKSEEVTPVEVKADVPVIDAMTAKQAWRTDMPGSPVKDIRSAISLNDRILFINFLFKEDPMAFQDMLTRLNSMNSFDEAASYVISVCPDWDLESDTVYRFMMALRRRLQ